MMMFEDLLPICRKCGHRNALVQQTCSKCDTPLGEEIYAEASFCMVSELFIQVEPNASAVDDLPSIPRSSRAQLADPWDPMINREIGNFRLMKKLGMGGFGSVYLAEHISLEGHYVAVKILHTGLQDREEVQKRFKQEAKVIAKLRHKHVVQLIDFGTLEPHAQCYLVMEYLEGKTLHQCLAEQETFFIPRVVPIIQQICSVLHHAHEMKIFHRDLKPANLFLIRDRFGYDDVKVIDFGIAKMKEGVSMTEIGLVMGTSVYMSPEQAAGMAHLVDGRSDLYSLAIILFKLLTGCVPFQGEARVVEKAHQHKPPPRLFEIMPTKSWAQELEDFFARALAKDPNQRPKDANQFWKECQHALQCQMAQESAFREYIVAQPLLVPPPQEPQSRSSSPLLVPSVTPQVVASVVQESSPSICTPPSYIPVAPTLVWHSSTPRQDTPIPHRHKEPHKAPASRSQAIPQGETIQLDSLGATAQLDSLGATAQLDSLGATTQLGNFEINWSEKTGISENPYPYNESAKKTFLASVASHSQQTWIWGTGFCIVGFLGFLLGTWFFSSSPTQAPKQPQIRATRPNSPQAQAQMETSSLVQSSSGTKQNRFKFLPSAPSVTSSTISPRQHSQSAGTGGVPTKRQIVRITQLAQTTLLVDTKPSSATFVFNGKSSITPQRLQGTSGSTVHLIFSKVGYKKAVCSFQFPLVGEKRMDCVLSKKNYPRTTEVLVHSTPSKAAFIHRNKVYVTPHVLFGYAGQDINLTFKKPGHVTTTCLFTFPAQGRSIETCKLQAISVPKNSIELLDDKTRQRP